MKYYFWILGCAMNHSDAERIASVLDSLGYEKTEKESEADLFITIACSVRQHAIDRIYGKAREFKEFKARNPKFKTILSGCILEKDRKKLANIFDIIFEIKDVEMLAEMLGNILGETETEKLGKSGEYLSIVPHYESTFRAFVPISTGCNNFCTYCAVPYTRGREKSRPMDEIIEEVKYLVKSGYKEITLLGQNVNSYGQDLEPNLNNDFVQLLLKIDKIKGDFRVYFYSNHPKDFSDKLIETLVHLTHFPHYIHLPLQSGNDEIIKKMNRHYAKKQYLNLVEKIRYAMPDVVLTTDIIVGFPTESLEQFQDTVEVMEKAKFDMAYIAQYSSRPGTVSAKMIDDVPEGEKKKREDILQKILAVTAVEKNQKLIGTTQKVLIDGIKGEKYYGRTTGYKVVEIKTDQVLKPGQFIDVKIKKATAWKLSGSIVVPTTP
jgi:tRNA-2-methylthio-N6-dimethylallyladenosine synthase